MKKILPVLLFLIFLILVGKPHAFAQSFESPTTSPAPKGQIIKLDFSIPGIGSGSGNFEPLHKERNTIIYFYSPDANSSDSNVKPITSVTAKSTYDDDQNSPTFGSFIAQDIDLGTKVKDGRYQIRFKTGQALSKLVKTKEGAVGGKVFEVNNSYGQIVNITGQIVIIGDIYPSSNGDDLIDSNDSNALNECFGDKANSPSCTDKSASDLDDNGVIDGTDYNLLAGSFRQLKELGLLVQPTPAVTSNPKISKALAKPTMAQQAKNALTKNSGKPINIFMIFFIIFIFVDLIVAAIIIMNKRKRAKLVENIAQVQADTEPSNAENLGSSGETIDKDFFVKKQADDPDNKRMLLSLTDDSGPTLGYYAGTAIKEGYAKVKGVLKKEGNKTFIQVEEISPVEPTDTPS